MFRSRFTPNVLSTTPTKKTESAIVYTGACVFRGILLGTDGANDPTITVYDGTSNAGTEILPTCTYDASALGLNGVTGINPGIYCSTGLYVEITCAGTVEVIVNYTPYSYTSTLGWQ